MTSFPQSELQREACCYSACIYFAALVDLTQFEEREVQKCAVMTRRAAVITRAGQGGRVTQFPPRSLNPASLQLKRHVQVIKIDFKGGREMWTKSKLINTKTDFKDDDCFVMKITL